MKILIIEDEKPIALGLKAILEEYHPVGIVGTAANIGDAIDLIKENSDLDLIFSDIRIEDGYCFDVFNSVTTNALIIFTTAYEEYALKAFDYDCIDYIMKPYDKKEIFNALDKYNRHLIHTRIKDARETSESMMNSDKTRNFRRKIEIHKSDSVRIIETRDISYIEYELGTVKAYCNDKTCGIIDSSLTGIGKELDNSVFVKVSRNHIININQVERIISTLKRNKLVELKEPYRNVRIEVCMETAKALKQMLLK